MFINRETDGKQVSIMLTDQELYDAYKEQQFKFDCQDCEDIIAGMDNEDVLAKYGVSDEMFCALLEDMAAEKRRLMDRYDMDWETAREKAAKEIIRRHLDMRDATKPELGSEVKTDIEVPEDVAEKIKAYLNAETEDEFQDKDKPISCTGYFADGIRMTVMCFGSQNGPSLAQAALLAENGVELCRSEPKEKFFGRWKLEHDGVSYAVDVNIRRLW